MALDKAHITWVDDDGSEHIHFYDANLSFDEFEYLNATEHVNSIFNLISIIRYNYKNSIEEHFYPLRIKSSDINLIYNVHIYK